MPKLAVEGFNTYFRQTVRPRIRDFNRFSLNIEGNTKYLVGRLGRVFGLS
jgi:hypothetical protein